MSKNNTQALDEGWVFQCDGESDWLNATVPGCVHLDLLNNELIPDPYFGLNEKNCNGSQRKIGTTDCILLQRKNSSKKRTKDCAFMELIPMLQFI